MVPRVRRQAGERDGPVGADELPRIAEEAVVLVDRARAAEAVAVELLLERGRHAGDRLVATALERWIGEVARKMWIQGDSASFSASQAASISFSTDRDRLTTVAPFTFLATA